jgi:hypothetical protein
MFMHVYNDHKIFSQNDQQCATLILELTNKGINKRIDKGADQLNSVLSEARQFSG